MSIESYRTTGAVAACLILTGAVSQIIILFQYTLPITSISFLLLSGVSSIFGVLGLVGLILFFVAMYEFSKDYSEHRIFDYIIYGLVVTIVAGAIALIIGFAVAFSNIARMFPNFGTSPPPNLKYPRLSSERSCLFSPFSALSG